MNATEHFETYAVGEDVIVLAQDGTIRTYTSGTSESLYCGSDRDAAAKSLEMSREDFDAALMSDPA